MRRGWGVLAICATLAHAQDVVDLARKAPPELFADAVIRLAERGKIPDPAQRRALLEEAFEASRHAKEPVRLTAVPQLSDRRPGLREAALRAGLDALSLQARVLTLLAAADADRARELFRTIDHPQLDPRPCEDPMIADDSAYFDMAAKFGDGLNVLLGPGNSPGELASLAKMLLADDSLPRDRFQLLEGALALKMQMAALDYRAFTSTAEDLAKALDGLTMRARELHVSADGLGEAAKKLAIAQLSSARCNEEFGGSTPFVEWFNRTFGKNLDVIVHDQMVAKEGLGPAKAQAFFSTVADQALAAEFERLRAGRIRGDASKPEWTAQLTEFLNKFAAWKPAGDAMDVFHQRMTVGRGLFQVIPPGPARDQFAATLVEYLQANPAERDYPAEWQFEVRTLTEFELVDKAKLLAAFRDSGDPALALFAALNP